MPNQQHLSSLLRDLLTDNRFNAVREVADSLRMEWALPKGTRKRLTQFETVWEVAKTEGKIDGISELFKKLEDIASHEQN